MERCSLSFRQLRVSWGEPSKSILKIDACIKCGVEPPGPLSGSCPRDAAFAWRSEGWARDVGPRVLQVAGMARVQEVGACGGIYSEVPDGEEQTELGGSAHMRVRIVFHIVLRVIF